MTGITDIGADAAQSSSPSNDGDDSDDYESEYERYDLNGVNFGKQHPASAIRMNAVALRKLYDENDPDRADVAVIGEDASIVTSEADLQSTVVVHSSDESDQFKVVNLEDEGTSVLGAGGKQEHIAVDKSDEFEDSSASSNQDSSEPGETILVFETEEVEVEDEDGNVETETQIVTDDNGEKLVAEEMDMSDAMAIDFASNTFYGDLERDFDGMDEIALKRGALGAGQSIYQSLDVAGARYAQSERDEDGDVVLHDGGFPQHNGGLIEPAPDDSDERDRQARDPELRPDVEGHDIIVMIQRLSEVDPDYNGRAYWATVFASMDDERMEELAEQYAEESEDRTANDFMVELDGDTFIRLQPTGEFEPDEDLLRDTGWIEFDENRADPDEINERRVEEGFDEYDFESSSDTTESDSESEESESEEEEATASAD